MTAFLSETSLVFIPLNSRRESFLGAITLHELPSNSLSSPMTCDGYWEHRWNVTFTSRTDSLSSLDTPVEFQVVVTAKAICDSTRSITELMREGWHVSLTGTWYRAYDAISL